MAGALEPYLDSLRRELQAPGPAAFSVLLALLLVALTLRESRGRCGGVRGAARPPVSEAGLAVPRSALEARAGREERPQGRAAAGAVRRGQDAAVRQGECGTGRPRGSLKALPSL